MKQIAYSTGSFVAILALLALVVVPQYNVTAQGPPFEAPQPDDSIPYSVTVEANCTEDAAGSLFPCPFFWPPVPQGKMLVIEHLNMKMFREETVLLRPIDLELVTTIPSLGLGGFVVRQYYLGFEEVEASSDGNVNAAWIFDADVKGYVVEGRQPRVNVRRFSRGAGIATLTGRLVPGPSVGFDPV